MSQFYKAEAKAFKPSVVVEAFRNVGLMPWNPETIKKNCMENCPPRAELVSDVSLKAAITAIKECEQEKLRQCRDMVDELEPARIECVQKAKKRVHQELVCVRTTDEGGKERHQSKFRKKKDMPTAPPEKKARRMSLSRIQCCVEGCGKRLICSKNWKKCPKCNKDFCPSHAKHYREHSC